jgi:hypothetical protein
VIILAARNGKNGRDGIVTFFAKTVFPSTLNTSLPAGSSARLFRRVGEWQRICDRFRTVTLFAPSWVILID